jgi:hypothetical protein
MKKLNALLLAAALTAAVVGYSAGKATAHPVKAQECCTGGNCCTNGACQK